MSNIPGLLWHRATSWQDYVHDIIHSAVQERLAHEQKLQKVREAAKADLQRALAAKDSEAQKSAETIAKLEALARAERQKVAAAETRLAAEQKCTLITFAPSKPCRQQDM